MQKRKIIHIDMDAFFASIEQRDNPELRGRPVIVGGSPESRGVVATASYEARKFGIRSAMSAATAKRRCPHAVFVKPRFEVYRAVSQQVMEMLGEYSDLLERTSIDEAYLDVTCNKRGLRYASEAAKEILRRITAETSLTASAGVAPNKFLAKIASDMRKPNGLTVIVPEEVQHFLHSLPVRKVPGIGSVTERRMKQYGIRTVSDLSMVDEATLIERFGKSGAWFYRISHGIDERPVITQRVRKSLSAERTFPEDLTDLEALHGRLTDLSDEVAARAQRSRFSGRTVTLKVTYADFTKVTRSRTADCALVSSKELFGIATELLQQTDAGVRALRLLGLGISNATSVTVAQSKSQQLSLF